jgi:AcrR family transcriptional regulator
VKQEERRAATRDAVLRAAEQMFGNYGYALTSVDDIAASAGVAKGAIYHHFQTKAELFEAVLEIVSARTVAYVVQATMGATDFWTVLEIGNEAFFAACADPATSKILLHDGPAILGWAKWRAIDERNFGGLLRHIFTTGIENGLISARDPGKMAKIILGAVTEAAIDAAESENYEESAAQYAKIISAMISGWAIPA